VRRGATGVSRDAILSGGAAGRRRFRLAGEASWEGPNHRRRPITGAARLPLLSTDPWRGGLRYVGLSSHLTTVFILTA